MAPTISATTPSSMMRRQRELQSMVCLSLFLSLLCPYVLPLLYPFPLSRGHRPLSNSVFLTSAFSSLSSLSPTEPRRPSFGPFPVIRWGVPAHSKSMLHIQKRLSPPTQQQCLLVTMSHHSLLSSDGTPHDLPRPCHSTQYHDSVSEADRILY